MALIYRDENHEPGHALRCREQVGADSILPEIAATCSGIDLSLRIADGRLLEAVTRMPGSENGVNLRCFIT